MAILDSSIAPRSTTNNFVWVVAGKILVVLTFLLGGLALGLATDVQVPEYRVKAAFLYNFTKLVDWPTNAFTSPSDPLIIGILGEDPFGEEIDNVLAKRKVNGRDITPVRLKSIEASTNCHILFISESERRRLDSIFVALKDKPILTVSDISGFSSQGIIELVKSNRTINLSINPTAANHVGLVLSSRLLRLDKKLRPIVESQTNSPTLKTVPRP